MERLSRTWNVLFVVWLGSTLLAAVPAWPLARELAGLRDGRAASLERATELGESVSVLVLVTFGLVVLWALLAPLLSMTWLSALAHPSTFGEALARGSALYLRALLLALIVLPAFVIGVLAILLPAIAAATLDGTLTDMMVDALTIACALPGLAVVGAALVLHDLARAALVSVTQSPFRALLHALRRLRGPALGTWLSLFLAGALIAALGHAIGATTLESGLLAVPLLAIIALARLALRGLWLSYTVDAVG